MQRFQKCILVPQKYSQTSGFLYKKPFTYPLSKMTSWKNYQKLFKDHRLRTPVLNDLNRIETSITGCLRSGADRRSFWVDGIDFPDGHARCQLDPLLLEEVRSGENPTLEISLSVFLNIVKTTQIVFSNILPNYICNQNFAKINMKHILCS